MAPARFFRLVTGHRSPRFDTYAASWLASAQDRMATGSYRAYESIVRVHLVPALGAVPLSAITRAHVKATAARVLHAGASWNTARQVLLVLRVCLASAVDDGLLAVNPAQRIGRQTLGPRWYRRPPRIFTREELRAVLHAARDGPCALLFLVLARTGLRIGEALGLQWSDWHADARALHVQRQWRRGAVVPTTKTRRSRLIDVSAQTAAALNAALRRSAWCFPGPLGVPVSEPTVRYWLAAACAAAAVVGRVSPHAFRHTYAARLLERGVSIAYVQRQLGHATIALTVDLYGAHAVHRNLAAVDGLDE